MVDDGVFVRDWGRGGPLRQGVSLNLRRRRPPPFDSSPSKSIRPPARGHHLVKEGRKEGGGRKVEEGR